MGYANVLEPEFAVFGHLSSDTLFHTAVSAMLSRHGVVSTGLDGLVPLRYHVLSHLWIGRVAEWLQTTPIHGYYLVEQLVALPLLLFGLVIATAIHSEADDSRAIRFPDTVLFPVFLLLTVAIWDWASYLVSELYTLALLVFGIALPLLLEEARETSQSAIDFTPCSHLACRSANDP